LITEEFGSNPVPPSAPPNSIRLPPAYGGGGHGGGGHGGGETPRGGGHGGGETPRGGGLARLRAAKSELFPPSSSCLSSLDGTSRRPDIEGLLDRQSSLDGTSPDIPEGMYNVVKLNEEQSLTVTLLAEGTHYATRESSFYPTYHPLKGELTTSNLKGHNPSLDRERGRDADIDSVASFEKERGRRQSKFPTTTYNEAMATPQAYHFPIEVMPL